MTAYTGSPSPLQRAWNGITSITRGGTDMRTAYVSASSTGHLLKIEDWPRPGLRLNYAR